jgi:virulence factor Mce-like protein
MSPMPRRGRSADRSRSKPRRDQRGMSTFKAGAVLIGVLVVASYFGFTKHIPFTHGYRVSAVFENANEIRPGSPVRIAGVNVGKVKHVDQFGNSAAAKVSMELDDAALPIHKDATFKIRPRIFLEGNFFVDLRPGTPSAGNISQGDTIPMTQTSNPVQLDQVLTSLQSDARTDLQDLLDSYGTALTATPTAADNATQDPAVRGETAAKALNDTYITAGAALQGTAIVNESLRGTEPKDLSKFIKNFGTVARALDANEGQLKDFVTNFNTFTGALASQSTALRQSIRLLGPTLETANATLGDLNAAFPATRAFARDILPGVRETPATINASFPFIRETRRWLAPSELQGLTKQLRPTSAALAKFTDQSIKLLPQLTTINRCITDVILPTGDVVVQEGALTSGAANYKEFWYALVGLAGEGQNFDGNGMYVRFQPGGGSQTVSTGSTNLGGAPLFGNVLSAPIGTRPAYPRQRPPYKPDVPCYTQKRPDINGPAASVGPAETLRATNATPRSLLGQGLSGMKASGAASTAGAAGATSNAGAAAPSGGGSNAAGGGSVVDDVLSRLNPFRQGAKP